MWKSELVCKNGVYYIQFCLLNSVVLKSIFTLLIYYLQLYYLILHYIFIFLTYNVYNKLHFHMLNHFSAHWWSLGHKITYVRLFWLLEFLLLKITQAVNFSSVFSTWTNFLDTWWRQHYDNFNVILCIFQPINLSTMLGWKDQKMSSQFS